MRLPVLLGALLATASLGGCASMSLPAMPTLPALPTVAWPNTLPWQATPPPQPVAYAAPMASVPALVEEVGPHRALARLPAAAGAPLSVGERRSVDQIEQEIVLASPALATGQNRIQVTLRSPDRTAGADDSLFRPSEASIARELASAFPFGALRPTNRLIANAEGPIGVATGRVAGLACAYAWQTVTPPSIGSGWFGVAPTQPAIAVRARVCHPTLSEDDLVAVMAGLTLARGPGFEAMPMSGLPSTSGPVGGACSGPLVTAGVCQLPGYTRAPTPARIAAQPVRPPARPVSVEATRPRAPARAALPPVPDAPAIPLPR